MYGVSGSHEIVDGSAISQVGEVHFQLAPQVPNVVERAARDRADERMYSGAEPDERFGQVRPHEAVCARDQRGPVGVGPAELVLQSDEFAVSPRGLSWVQPQGPASLADASRPLG